MAIASARQNAALIILMSVLGLGPAAAGAPTRLLFLGISSAGYTQQQAESAVQLRLTGLEVSVVRPKVIHIPPCETATCLASALSTEHTNLALIGRIRKNAHACVAMLWLLSDKDRAPLERELVCQLSGNDSDLGADLAAAAGDMVEDYLRELNSKTTDERSEFFKRPATARVSL